MVDLGATDDVLRRMQDQDLSASKFAGFERVLLAMDPHRDVMGGQSKLCKLINQAIPRLGTKEERKFWSNELIGAKAHVFKANPRSGAALESHMSEVRESMPEDERRVFK